jgi:hypothetical protein
MLSRGEIARFEHCTWPPRTRRAALAQDQRRAAAVDVALLSRREPSELARNRGPAIVEVMGEAAGQRVPTAGATGLRGARHHGRHNVQRLGFGDRRRSKNYGLHDDRCRLVERVRADALA